MKAVIFDLDGVISDTNFLQSRVEENLLKKYGINLSYKEITEKYAGMSDKEFFKTVFDDFKKKCDINEIIKEKWENIFELAKKGIKPMPGALKLINRLKNSGFKLAVSSASRKDFIKLVLSELKILNKFDAITSGTEVKKGKPNPEIFLLTAKKLKVNPKNCIVIEDGRLGMIAAKKARMKCIGLVKNKKENYPADKIVSNLSQLNLRDFK
jgi:HAD superfamily hydrolase (TIGR01509 family)